MAPSARCRVCDHSDSRVSTCSPPMTTWIANSPAARIGDPGEGRLGAPVAPGDIGHGQHDEPDHGGHPAMQDVGRADIGQGRHERATHQRPVREDEGRVGGRHLRAEQEQGEGGHRGEGRQQGEPLAGATSRQAGRVGGPDGHEHEHADQEHGRRQVGRDRLPAVAEADRLAPQPGLEPDQPDRRDRRPQQARPIAVVADGQRGQAQDLEADDGRDGPVQPLDPGLRIVQRRQQLAVAQRPVGAAQAGIGGAHDDTDGDQQDGRPEGHAASFWKRVNGPPGEPREGRRWASDMVPRRRPRATSAIVPSMSHRTRPAAVVALLGLSLLLAACSAGTGTSAAPSLAPSGGPSASAAAGDCPTARAGRHARGLGTADDPAQRLPGHHLVVGLADVRPQPLHVLVPRRRQQPGRRPGPDRLGGLLRPGRRPRDARRQRRGHVHLGHRGRGRHLRHDRAVHPRRHVGRRVHDRRTGRHRGTHPPPVPGPARVARSWPSAMPRQPPTPRPWPMSVATSP